MQNHGSGAHKNGFTIVELLIVVVVIAILAAITVVSYNGISSRAHESVILSKADQLEKKVRTNKLLRGDGEVVVRQAGSNYPWSREDRLAANNLTDFRDACIEYGSMSGNDSYTIYDVGDCFPAHWVSGQPVQFNKSKLYITFFYIPSDHMLYPDTPSTSITLSRWSHDESAWMVKTIAQYADQGEVVTTDKNPCGPFPTEGSYQFDAQCRYANPYDHWPQDSE